MHPKRNRRDRTKKKTRITSSEEGEEGEEGEGGEESGGDIAEMRWRMKGGRERERRGESVGERGQREGSEGTTATDRPTGERTGRWEIFNTHFAKTILPRQPRDDRAAHPPTRADGGSAANGMAFISRQFVDPSPAPRSTSSFCVNSADKFVAWEGRGRRAMRETE